LGNGNSAKGGFKRGEVDAMDGEGRNKFLSRCTKEGNLRKKIQPEEPQFHKENLTNPGTEGGPGDGRMKG